MPARIGHPTNASVTPYDSINRRWPSASPPAWLPMEGTRNGSAPSVFRWATMARTIWARLAMPRLPTVTATVWPGRTLRPRSSLASWACTSAATSSIRGASKVCRTRKIWGKAMGRGLAVVGKESILPARPRSAIGGQARPLRKLGSLDFAGAWGEDYRLERRFRRTHPPEEACGDRLLPTRILARTGDRRQPGVVPDAGGHPVAGPTDKSGLARACQVVVRGAAFADSPPRFPPPDERPGRPVRLHGAETADSADAEHGRKAPDQGPELEGTDDE